MQMFQDCDDGNLAPTVEQIQNLLTDLINQMDVAYICIDALDECEPNVKTDLLQFFYVIIEQCSSFNVLVSSRTGDSEIAEFLEGWPSIIITPETVTNDIDLFVRYRIEKSSNRLKRAMTEHYIRKLIFGAEGM